MAIRLTQIKGKLIGGLIGLWIGHPFVMLMCVLAGHLYDRVQRLTNHARSHFSFQARPTHEVFFRSTFIVLGYVAKSDGMVSQREIDAAQKVMLHLKLTDAQKKQAIAHFNLGKEENCDINQVIQTLRRSCWRQPNLLRLFIEFQMQMGAADGAMSPEKKKLLDHICQQFRFFGHNFSQQRSQTHSTHTQRNPNSLHEAYSLLKVTPNTSDADVKKAYRKMMSKNHPDKLMAKGLPESMISLANEKTQQIKKAYDLICSTRKKT